jgi:hypothetical protein
MAINAKTILKRLEENQNDRGKVTLYLSKGLFKEFKSKCGDHSASVVLEELMKEFINSTKLNPRRSK